MATLTAKDIQAKADEWGAIQREIAAVEATIGDQIADLKAKADPIEKEVLGWLRVTNKIQRIEGETAYAELAEATKFGDREIDLEKFYKATATMPDKRDACLRVEVKKAEDLLGKAKVNEISERPLTRTTRATLKLKK